MREFLAFRTSHVLERNRWRGVIADHFVLTTPVEPYRAASLGENCGAFRRLRGVEMLVRDTVSITGARIDRERAHRTMRSR
jgi:hypothetical protein